MPAAKKTIWNEKVQRNIRKLFVWTNLIIQWNYAQKSKSVTEIWRLRSKFAISNFAEKLQISKLAIFAEIETRELKICKNTLPTLSDYSLTIYGLLALKVKIESWKLRESKVYFVQRLR